MVIDTLGTKPGARKTTDLLTLATKAWAPAGAEYSWLFYFGSPYKTCTRGRSTARDDSLILGRRQPGDIMLMLAVSKGD